MNIPETVSTSRADFIRESVDRCPFRHEFLSHVKSHRDVSVGKQIYH